MLRLSCRVAADLDACIAGAICLVGLLAACTPEHRPAVTKSAGVVAAASVDTSGVERPLWQFGESSRRTDSLPAELDSLHDWGDYAEAERLASGRWADVIT